MKVILFAIGLVFSSATFGAWGPADEDLENCRWRNGTAISESNCAEFRAEVAREKAARTMQTQMMEQSRVERERAAAEEKRRQDDIEKNRQKRMAEEALRDQENQRIREQEDRETAKQEAELKRKCGKDYLSPRIGMKLARAKLCIGDLALESQINRKDGIISTYNNGNMYIHVMDDRIVSWHKY